MLVGHVWGLTTLCLKPFMAATGAKTRQAARTSGGAKGCELGAALEASAVRWQLYALLRQCSAGGRLRTQDSTGRQHGGLRSTWATHACRDRSSLVLVLSMMHGVGEEVERALGACEEGADGRRGAATAE